MNILFRALIEVLGKPPEHVQASMKAYLEALRQDANFKVVRQELADMQKQEGTELWATFAELEIQTSKPDHIIGFCFEYMPSMVEILEPEQLTFTDGEASEFFNDLQARLHEVDMVAKQVKMENDMLKRNMGALLTNYVTVLLRKAGQLSAEQLSKLTGMAQEQLEDYLDTLIDKGKINLKEGSYYLVEPGV